MIPYYYPIIDSREAGLVKVRRRLPLPQLEDYFYFFSSTQEVNKWFHKFPIISDAETGVPQRIVQINIAVCIIPNYLTLDSYTLNLSDNIYQNHNITGDGDNVTLFALDIRFNRNILITDVIGFRLKQRYFFTPQTKIKKIGTG